MNTTNTFVSGGTQHMAYLTSLIRKATTALFIALLLVIFNNNSLAQPYCSMACNDHVNISLGPSCAATITYDLILEDGDNPILCLPNGPQAFVVTVMGTNGQPIPTSPDVTDANIGQTLSVKVKHWSTGNNCWSTISIEDKMPPILTCPPDTTVACSEPTSIALLGLPGVQDCSNFTLSNTDFTQTFGCNDPVSTITRTFFVVDEYDNQSSCNQVISFAQNDVTDIVFPPNLDDIEAPALDCSNPNTDPIYTGFPTINGSEITSGSPCSFGVVYNDFDIDVCDGTHKIIRTWTVADWCTGDVLTETQIITIKDDQGPTINCPNDVTVNTNSPVSCTGSVMLPEATVSDNCSSTINVTVNTPLGQINTNGGLLNNLSLGNYILIYTATDGCGNQSSCNMQLTVVDGTSPTMVCDEITTITLNATGTAYVPANVFDDGSYDNCCFDGFEVRRMEAGCGVSATFGSTVKLCCEDVGATVQVELQASDCAGNTNSCMVEVIVEDKVDPTIVCPPNITLECTDDANDITLIGEPIANDACSFDTVTVVVNDNTNQCGTGTITRAFTVVDLYGNNASCTQTITVVDVTPIAVVFPDDYTITGCNGGAGLHPDSLPAPFDYPEVFGDDCELVAYNFDDQLFTVAPPACFKIVRDWTIINWCEYNPNAGVFTGIYTSQQILTVMDNEAPTLTCPDDQIVQIFSNDCFTDLALPTANADDCSDVIDITITSDFGNGNGPFYDIAPGEYSAVYLATDGCGNSSSCSIDISVVDGKKPTPYCKDGLVISLMNTNPPMVDIWANDFDEGSFDNCAGDVQISFSADVNITSLTFTCDDIGENPIQMWVTDAVGNQDFCETFVIIQDNMGICSNNNTPLVASGTIQNDLGYNVEFVTVDVNDGINAPVTTAADGTFNFDNLSLGSDYTVTPEKNMNPLNGVTTLDLVQIQRHILGISPMTSPYRLIAADANRSNSLSTLDLVELQQMILLINLEFPNNTSWRFIDADYEFLNPANPFAEDFPEVYNINNMANDMENINFIAIKVGDANGNAIANNLMEADDRNTEDELTFVVDDRAFAAGEQVRIDFTAQDFSDILGYQFTINFDYNSLDFIDYEAGALPNLGEGNFGFRFLEEGKITTSWHDVEVNNLDADAVLFSLIFQAKTNESLNNTLEITSDLTTAEAYSEDGDLYNVVIQFAGQHGISFSTRLLENYPNPFNDATTIRYYLAEAQSLALTVANASGQVVYTQQLDGNKGENQILIHKKDLPATGVFWYTIQTKDELLSGKMIALDQSLIPTIYEYHQSIRKSLVVL